MTQPTKNAGRPVTRRWVLTGLAGGAAAALLPMSCHGSAPDVGTLLEPIRRQYDLPALAAAVLVGGKTQGVGAVGVRQYGGSVAVTPNDQFHLGSDTKAMTATLCGMLIEAGALDWDTPLAHVFPHIPMRPEYRRVTLDHLLAHRSGFSADSWPAGMTGLDIHRLPGSPRAQRAAYMRLILAEPPVSAPGTHFLYSNRSYAVAGAILETLTGVPWETFIRERLFTPLDMTTAGFGAMGTPGKPGLPDQPWQYRMDGGTRVPVPPGPLADNPPAIAPAGAVHCSAGDWSKFVVLHLAGEQGASRLLRPTTVRRLHAPQFGGDYAGGWLVAQRPWGGGRVLTHAGSNTQNYAVAWVAPVKNFAALVMTDQGGVAAAQATDDAAATLIREFA